jgi:hypothetical protein
MTYQNITYRSKGLWRWSCVDCSGNRWAPWTRERRLQYTMVWLWSHQHFLFFFHLERDDSEVEPIRTQMESDHRYKPIDSNDLRDGTVIFAGFVVYRQPFPLFLGDTTDFSLSRCILCWWLCTPKLASIIPFSEINYVAFLCLFSLDKRWNNV